MPIYTAKTYDGLIESVILARNIELAHAYWQGKGITACSVIEHNESDLEKHPTGILPIVTTRKVDASPFGAKSKQYLAITK